MAGCKTAGQAWWLTPTRSFSRPHRDEPRPLLYRRLFSLVTVIASGVMEACLSAHVRRRSASGVQAGLRGANVGQDPSTHAGTTSTRQYCSSSRSNYTGCVVLAEGQGRDCDPGCRGSEPRRAPHEIPVRGPLRVPDWFHGPNCPAPRCPMILSDPVRSKQPSAHRAAGWETLIAVPTGLSTWSSRGKPTCFGTILATHSLTAFVGAKQNPPSGERSSPSPSVRDHNCN